MTVPDLEAGKRFWTKVMGFEPTEHEVDSSGVSSFVQPLTGQRITLVETPGPDPALALAIRTEDVATALEAVSEHGFSEYWSSSSAGGTSFLMCQDGQGVAILLYQLR